MSKTGLKLMTEQAALIRECRGEIETTKLTVWRLRAELDEVQMQSARAQKRLRDGETQYEKLVSEGRKLRLEVIASANTFSKDHCKALSACSGKAGLFRIVAEAVCSMCGFEERSWEFFKKLIAQFEALHECLLAFNPASVAPCELSHAQTLSQSQNLGKLHNSDTLPRELQPLVGWLVAACELSSLEVTTQDTASMLPGLAREKNELYCDMKDLEEAIREEESKLCRLLQCVHMAESIVRKIRSREEVSKEEVEETENMWREAGRREMGVGDIITHIAKSEECRVLRELDAQEVTNSASLVAAVYVSHAISPQLQEQLRGILERNGKDDTGEDDHTVTLHVPKPSYDDSASPLILASTDSQETSQRQDSRKKPKRRKNRCCGFV